MPRSHHPLEDELLRAEARLAAAAERAEQARMAFDAAQFDLGVAESELDGAQATVERLRELERSMQRREHPIEVSTSEKSRTDAIVDILKANGSHMSINDVLVELHQQHDASVEYPVVASTLNYLAKEGRIGRPTRGRYAAR